MKLTNSVLSCVGDKMPSLRKMIPEWVKAPTRGVIESYRQSTSGARPLPHFLIVGAQKAGTSSLYSYLRQHPQLYTSYQKEVHFFDGGLNPTEDNFEKGAAWYQSNFPPKSGMDAGSKVFEASPLYFGNPLVPKRIFDLLPEIKLIVILRNPTERAISQYFMEYRKGRESLPIMEALLAEEDRLKPFLAAGDYKSPIFMYHSYKLRGLYKQQLERYLEYFPKKQMLIMSSEWFFSHPEQALEKVFRFVGVDVGFKVEDLKPRNVAKNKKNTDPDVSQYLNDYFLPHNQDLYQLVGEDYGWEH